MQDSNGCCVGPTNISDEVYIRGMLATCIAILVIFALTLLAVPLLYRERARRTAVPVRPPPVET